MELTKYKLCPECRKQNPPSLFECRYCEADLTGIQVTDSTAEPDSEETAEICEEYQPELVRICECGAENLPQARKCSACGEDISDILPGPRKTKGFRYELKSVDGGFTTAIEEMIFVVGREAGLCDYLADKLYVSRQHAKLSVVAEKVFIENLSRTNKTFVNDQEIPDGAPFALKHGDEIGLGGKVIDGKRQEKAAYFVLQVNA